MQSVDRLTPFEREVLEALATPNTRWHTIQSILNQLDGVVSVSMLVSTLGGLRRRELVVVNHPGQTYRPSEYSISTLGRGLLDNGEQMLLDDLKSVGAVRRASER